MATFVGEQQAARILARLLTTFGKAAWDRRTLKRNAEKSVRLAGGVLGDEVVNELDDKSIRLLCDYLAGHDVANIAHQMYLARALEQRRGNAEELLSACRDQIRLGLRNRLDLDGERLFELTEVVFRDVLQATQLAWSQLNGGGVLPTSVNLAVAGRVTGAAVRNTELMATLSDLQAITAFETEMAGQVRRLHAEMRLPHAGTSKTVPYEQLYVQPRLRADERTVLIGDPLVTDLHEKIRRRGRLVVLGAPGAGKSTLANKLAHDLAVDTGTVAFLLVLRELASGFDKGGRAVVDYLEPLCRDPYNVEPPPGAVDYLLLNGRAVVIFDGLDELVDTALRTKVVRLIEGFIARYPMTPVVVTSRIVGYDAAPLAEGLVEVAYLDDFQPEQVDEYAGKWFQLDESVPAKDRETLKDAFVRDSELVEDLRRNALMLSLLCGMYATERYIPRNRPDVFERCATMLFDRWDRMRGVDGSAPFANQVRSAVQHLAWKLFTDTRYGGAMARRELIEELATNFFGKRHQDADLARDEADKFLDFCTGRAWVLSDIGATQTENRYGFTHRSFLEFFAAEHLVRARGSSPSRVFQSLASHLEKNEWEVVSQLSLQILERNIAGGGDRFLSCLVRRAKSGTNMARNGLLFFVSRSTEYVVMSRATVRAVMDCMLDEEELVDMVRYPSDFTAGSDSLFSGSFSATAYFLANVTADNTSVVARELPGLLALRLDRGTRKGEDLVAYLSYAGLLSRNELARALRESGLHQRDAVVGRYLRIPALTFYEAASVTDDVERAALLRGGLVRFGGQLLYSSPLAGMPGRTYVSVAAMNGQHFDPHNQWTTEACVQVIDAFFATLDQRPALRIMKNSAYRVSIGGELNKESLLTREPRRRLLALALLAPMAELSIAERRVRDDDVSDVLQLLMKARLAQRPDPLEELWTDTDCGSRTFLDSWIKGTVSTVAFPD